MKKWFIALLFVFACLPVVAVKAAPPQTYIHLDYEIIEGRYHLQDGLFMSGASGWRCSNKIQIPKNVDKIYLYGWLTHCILFFDNETYIGFYYDRENVSYPTWEVDAVEKILGLYSSDARFTHMFDKLTNTTHIALQSCVNPSAAGLEEYIGLQRFYFGDDFKPLIYYPAPADAAANITFNLMPMLMIMIVIAGLTGSLIMITKKSKR